MNKEVKFNSKNLLDIKFEKDVKGYNPLQVDQILDLIIEDYKQYEEKTSKFNESAKQLSQEIESLKEKVRSYEIELAKCKATIKSLPSTNNLSKDNLDLLKRIDALERALYKKGVDPKKI